MKKVNPLSSFIFVLICWGFAVQAAPISLVGKWYGLKDGSPITLEFRNDQTMSIYAEAFSALSFTGQYKVDSAARPMKVDLDIPGGMTCSAIVSFSDKGEMELFGFFGAPGYTQRPTQIEISSTRVDALYLKLSRNANLVKVRAQPAPPAKEAKLAFTRNKRLGRGINLNGLLDNNSGDKPIKPEYIKMIAKAGFNSVRLPVTWSVHSLKSAPYTVDPAFFSRVDSIVNLCLKNGLAVSIDLHYYPYINMAEGDSTISFDDNIKRYYLLWAQIAKHYKNYPPEVYFDLLNEPNLEMGAKLWNELIAKSVKLIRKTNPGRTILIGTPNLAQSWTIGLLELPSDEWNLIVQIHYYLPHLFTHQGLAYARAESSIGMKWNGIPEEKKPIESDLNYCAKWGKVHFRPINLGEFGVNENADMASRARYIAYVVELADKYGFSYHIWGFREIFRVFDETNGKWRQTVMEALIPGNH